MENIFSTDKKLFSVFVTAGYPKLDSTLEICSALEKSGVDLIEIGIPCSDPLADGPIIQYSSMVSLDNGFQLKCFFNELVNLKKHCKVPVLLMGYYNQVIQFGEIEFVNCAKACGISGFIIPDQPEFSKFHDQCQQTGLMNVRMICPSTSVARIKEIDALSTGFIYAVSSSSTTGSIKFNMSDYLQELDKLNLKNPVLTGFGIKNKETFDQAVKYTNGGIVGSAFLQLLKDKQEIMEKEIIEFVKSFK